MIIFAPSRTFALRPAGAYYKPWLYAFLASLTGGLAGQAADLAFGGNSGYEILLDRLPLQVLWAVVGLGGLALYAWVAHVLLRSNTAPAPYWATARVLAYTAAVPMLYAPLEGALDGLTKGQGFSPDVTVMIIPFAVWGVYLQCLALDLIHGKGKWRTFFIVLLIDLIFGIIISLASSFCSRSCFL